MTLVALTLDGKEATVCTDSMSYINGSCALIGGASKVRGLPHLDTVLVGQGLMPTEMVVTFAHDDPELNGAPDLDLLVAGLPRVMRALWESARCEGKQGELFAVGWSPLEGRMAAWRLSSLHDFEPAQVPDLMILPAPSGYALSDAEVDEMTVFARSAVGHDVVLSGRAALPSYPRPRKVGDWVTLARTVRETRSMRDSDIVIAGQRHSTKWPIGGDLHLTRIRVGEQVTRCVYTWPDDAADTQRAMFRDSLHPLLQADPCACGSGDRWVDCCLAQHLDEPCACGMDATLGECCAITSARWQRLSSIRAGRRG